MIATAAPPSTALRVVSVQRTHPDWDALVRSREAGTFCQLAGWREIMADVFGHDTPYLAAVDDAGVLHGVLPLVRLKNRLFGHHLLSVPYLNYGGPVGTPEAIERLMHAAMAMARDTGADRLELRSRTPIPGRLSPSREKVFVTLPLPASADTLWNQVFRSHLRNKIQRPRKEGMEARFGACELAAFYEVFARNMRDLGTPVLPRRFFDRIVATFPEHSIIGAVYWKGRPIAAGYAFDWRGEMEMSWSSSVREHRNMKANMLLYWAFMERAIERGTRTFNFGRSTPGTGTHSFKLEWGGTDNALPWVEWSAGAAGATAAPGTSRLQIAANAWARLPLSASKLLGPPLSRLLPYY